MECTWSSTNDCLKLFKAILYTNPVVNLTFDENGMHVSEMDASKTSLVRLDLSPSFFASYKPPPEPILIGIHSEMVTNILQKAKQSQMAWKATSETLGIMLYQNDQKTMFGIRGIDIDSDQLEATDIPGDVAVKIKTSVLREWMDKMLMSKTDVMFKLTKETFECASSSVNFGDIQHIEPIGGDRIMSMGYKEDVNITLGFHAVKSLHTFAGSGGDICQLRFSNQQPTQLYVDLGHQSHLILYVAPKIEDEY